MKKEEEQKSFQIEVARNPEEVILEKIKVAKALQKIVDENKLWVKINQKKYLFVEAWQTLASFFNITATVEWSKPIFDHSDKLLGYEARAVCLYKGCVISSGEAECRFSESSKNWQKKSEFQLRSMAQTRAISKAFRNCLSHIVVLAGYSATPAEEIIEESKPWDKRKEKIKAIWEIWNSCGKTKEDLINFLKEKFQKTSSELLSNEELEQLLEISKKMKNDA